MTIPLPDPSEEAKRLLSDPDHLRRKADYIETQFPRGGPLEGSRRDRVKELRDKADQIEKAAAFPKADPFAGIVDVKSNDGWDA